MSKFTCLVLCAVVMSFSSVYADEEDQVAFREAIKPLLMECMKEHGISEADIMKAKEVHNPDTLKPCFLGCVFKKFEFINDKGDYDSETSLAKIKNLIKNDDYFAKLTDIAKKCESVNAQAVSDGDAGCERAVLLAKCFSENRSELSM